MLSNPVLAKRPPTEEEEEEEFERARQLRRSGGSREPLHITRHDLKNFRRVLIKVGTTVVTDTNGRVALGRLGNLVEQICGLMQEGKQVILVSSGAIGIGKQRLLQQAILSSSLRFHVHGSNRGGGPGQMSDRACAAAGQSGLMSLYSAMFAEYNVACSQILVTDDDFRSRKRRRNLHETVDALLDLGVVPILNENDVISTRETPLRDEQNKLFWDNDSLACLVAAETDTDVLFLLTDVDGLYTSPPAGSGKEKPQVVHTYTSNANFTLGGKSRVGRGGMQAKIQAALGSIDRGVKAVLIASGSRPNVIVDCMTGQTIGTLFVKHPLAEPDSRTMALAARKAARQLQSLPAADRSRILVAIADGLQRAEKEIIDANARDIKVAQATTISSSALARLRMDSKKIKTLADGIRSIAAGQDCLGRVLRRTKLAPNLILQQETVAIGVLLVIFESRPDVLPQIAALSIFSGNAVLLKGGRESQHTNQALHKLIVDAVHSATDGRISSDVVALLSSREEVSSLLALHGVIDLIIPRGSNELVKSIQKNTRIPVLGHAAGICHMYIDEAADVTKALRLVLDAKLDYPAACNAVEAILIHTKMVENGTAARIIAELRKAEVEVFGGPRAVKDLQLLPATSLSHEYSTLACTVEIVDGVQQAIDFIHEYGSGHTDAVVTENADVANKFLTNVDSACVFHNASTRFADGYRFGLGAEVGISTGKIHARGPVGVDGLTSTKWKLVSTSNNGHIASEFTNGKEVFLHEQMPLTAKL